MTSTYALFSRLQGPTVHVHTNCPQHQIMALMCCDLTGLALSTILDLTGSSYNHSAASEFSTHMSICSRDMRMRPDDEILWWQPLSTHLYFRFRF